MSDAGQRLKDALSAHYRIERELGAGGMATVYLAEDLRHGRKVAVKVLRPDLAATLGPDRFLREVKIAANLQHPHVLPLYDSGQAEGVLYYVMPYVDGTSLREKLLREGELPIADAVRILRDVADALAYAHQHGVVHRDIKPENVMLSGRHAMVTDFGVAKAVSEATGRHTLTSAGVALGTPTYMAPEQATADPHTDHRADIYAFGVVAYELLSGQPPFSGPSAQAVLAAHVTSRVEPVTKYRAAIPPALAALVMRCLEKKAADRPQSADELIPVLETALTPGGGVTPHETQPISSLARRPRWIAIAGAIAIIGAIGVLTWRGFGNRKVAGPTVERLAVIPFDNRTGNPAHAELGAMAASWITQGLVDARLAEVVPNQVVAAAMAKARPGEAVTVAVVRETGATKLVTGSYYAVGDSVRFQADLIDGGGGKSLAVMEPVAALPSAAMTVIERLRQRTLGALAVALNPLYGATVEVASLPPSLEAYRTYVRASETLWYDLSGAERLFREVARMESTYVPAKLGLVNVLLLLAGESRVAEADSLVRVVEAQGARLSRWDRRGAENARGWLDGNQEVVYRTWAEDSAILGDGARRNQFGWEALMLNRPREALRTWSRVNPRSPEMTRVPYWTWCALAHHLLGDHEAELGVVNRGLEQYPRSMNLNAYRAVALAALGRSEDLERVIGEARNLPAEQQTDESASFGLLLLFLAQDRSVHGDSVQSREFAVQAADWMAALPSSERSGYRYSEIAALYHAGRFAEATAVVGTDCPAKYDGIPCMGWTGLLALQRGDTTVARQQSKLIESLHLRPRSLQSDQDYWLAAIAATQGEADRAVEYLRRALSKRRSPALMHYDPLLNPLRDNSGFKELVRPKG